MRRNRSLLLLGSVGILLLLGSAGVLMRDFMEGLLMCSRAVASLILLNVILMWALLTAALALAGFLVYWVQRGKNRRLVEEKDQYYRSSRQDSLTGLLNKSTLHIEIDKFTGSDPARVRRAALLLVDLDNFKSVNDTCGHATGDRALLLTARLLCEMFPCPELPGRVGGDEFAVWLPDTSDPARLQGRALELCRELADRSGEPETGRMFSCSVGAAFYPADGITFSDLFDAADSAMYRAKHQGKNTCVLAIPSGGPEMDP